MDQDFQGDKFPLPTESSDGQSIDVAFQQPRNSATFASNGTNVRSHYANNLKLKKDKIDWLKQMTLLKEKHFILPTPKFSPKKSAQPPPTKTRLASPKICEWQIQKNSPKFSSLGGSSVFANHNNDLLRISPLNIKAPENLLPADSQ